LWNLPCNFIGSGKKKTQITRFQSWQSIGTIPKIQNASGYPKGLSAFLFAWHANISEGLKEALAPNRREANAKATALLATVGWEGSLSKYGVRSASEPELARQEGNLAKSGNAQKSNNLPR
jgi:hypothetical protein